MAWPTTGWWTPGSTYGASQDWYHTPFSAIDLSENSQRGEWLRFLGESGFDIPGRMGQWGQNQFSNFLTGLESARLSNPALSTRDYLTGLGPDFLRRMYLETPMQQRGDFLPGQTRWIR